MENACAVARRGARGGAALLNHNSASDYERDKKKREFGREPKNDDAVEKLAKTHDFFPPQAPLLEKIGLIISQWNLIRSKDY